MTGKSSRYNIPAPVEYLTVEESAAKLDRHPEMVRRWIRGGKLHAQRVGGIYLVHRDVLRKFKPPEARPRIVRWLRATSRNQWHAIREELETLDSGEALCGRQIEAPDPSDERWLARQRPSDDVCSTCAELVTKAGKQ